jgi:hypothetical protein
MKASKAAAGGASRGNFRKRYDDIEGRRAALVARLNSLGAVSQRHPGHKRALTLLNDTFRKSKLAQRAAVLEAAAWLIDVLEHVTFIV